MAITVGTIGTKRALAGGAAASALLVGAAAAQGPLTPDLLSPADLTVGVPVPATTYDADWGDIMPFYGEAAPAWGDIMPFWGDVMPFWGDIMPFWGDIMPFAEGAEGEVAPAWGDIMPFWGDIMPFWGDIMPFWSAEANGFSDAELDLIAVKLDEMLAGAEGVFGATIEAREGTSFEDAFAAPLLDRYGIVRGDAGSLEALTGEERARFLIEFYDGLMAYSGRDQMDWWMGAVGWTPALAATQGWATPTVGLLDSPLSSGAEAAGNLVWSGGRRRSDGGPAAGHGTAVASLIAGAHDGRGVAGIAPNANLVAFNPFDASGTTDWYDVRRGVRRLRRKGAHVINLSIGTEGTVLTDDWADVLRGIGRRDDVVFVKSAGNDAVSAGDTFFRNTADVGGLLLVGSLAPSGEISAFSNTPGEGCFVSRRGCAAGDRVMDRFLVAPGELLLTDDGQGGTRRLSGTSFAAPLVTGTVALLQSRWPWLERHASTTASIVLRSATDLGDPGVDATYGWGLLNIEAAQSPLSFDDVLFYQPGRGGGFRSAGAMRDALVTPGLLDRLPDGAVLYGFEGVGATFRDFAVPLEARVASGSADRFANDRPVQGYLTDRLWDWAGGAAFAGETTRTRERRGYTLAITATEGGAGVSEGAMTLTNEAGASLTIGSGERAASFGSLLFDARRDLDPRAGGVPSVLGFARGGAYAAGSIPAGAFDLTFAAAQNDPQASRFGFAADPVRGQLGAEGYAARGASLGVARSLGDARLSVAYQHLEEANGVLGTQGVGALSLGGGARTNALSAEVVLPRVAGIAFGLSATTGRTSTDRDERGLLRLSDGAVSTAFAARASRRATFLRADRTTLTVSQPLGIADGDLVVEQVVVTDRTTGERGTAVSRYALTGERPLIVEADYAVDVLRGRATLAGTGSIDAVGGDTQAGLAVRARF